MRGTAQKGPAIGRTLMARRIGADVTMKRSPSQRPLYKMATGICGFDELCGGLPRNRTTLVMGGPGTGKTIFALQALVSAARNRKQPGIFVGFEESPQEIFANSGTFDWRLAVLAKTSLFFLDARLSPTVVQSGDFELTGMLAILKAKKRELGAKWIVFDGIDVLLALLQNRAAESRELYRLRDWLAQNELTALVTTKIDGNNAQLANYGFMQFMLDCVIRLDRRLEQGVPIRRLEITKYRGSDYSAGEFPLSFGPHGMVVAAMGTIEVQHAESTERVSTGFGDLDRMLGGGLFRGSSTLITGAPGTSKTTLAGQFAEHACRRGERTLFVSFDEGSERIRRNLTSVGINLSAHVKSGLLRMYSGRTDVLNPEEHLLRIAALVQEHNPRCVVIDPLSAIAKTGALSSARAIGNRLIYMVRDLHITCCITALVDGDDPQREATELQISTIADTWIHLSYVVRGGERNRALTIVKSRGTAHSNQVRELVLSASGPSMVDVYSSGGEVLMGTLRWEKEAEETARKLHQRAESSQKRRTLQLAEADTAARIAALQLDLERQRAELALYRGDEEALHLAAGAWKQQMRKMRNSDAAVVAAPVVKKPRNTASHGPASAKYRKNGDQEPRHDP
jgi:circadian clock protein KaiC